jgi:hypothetical protein
MVKVSIASLIYQSTKLADWVFSSIMKYTPMIRRGEADFFFVANDATQNVIDHLNRKGYPYVFQTNVPTSEEEMFKQGFAWPEYISRVYKGYNRALVSAKASNVVLINSDNFFSEDWLENLIKYYDPTKVVSSLLVEPTHPKYELFPGAVRGEFGMTVDAFKEEEFLSFTRKIKKTGARYGGAYMPCLLSRDIAIYSGLYPEGNLAGNSFSVIKETGDEAFFRILKEHGIDHITALDSVVYHLKEGEKGEYLEKNEHRAEFAPMSPSLYSMNHVFKVARAETKKYAIPLQPNTSHRMILAKLILLPNGIPSEKRIIRKRHSILYRYLAKIRFLKKIKKVIFR